MTRSKRPFKLELPKIPPEDLSPLVKELLRLLEAEQSHIEKLEDEINLKGRRFIVALNRRLGGHYNDYGLQGNSKALHRFYQRAIACAFKCLNRRGRKRNSFTWDVFCRAILRVGIARPRITEAKRRHVVYA